MNKETYLKRLEAELRGLDREEREEILAEYREHFEIALAEGREETGVALALGSPKELAREIRGNLASEPVEVAPASKTLFHMIFTAFCLVLFNLLIVAGLFAGVLATLGGLYVVVLACILSPVISLVMDGFPTTLGSGLNFFGALVLCVGGYFAVRWVIWLTKWLYKWFVIYLAYNIKLVKGNGVHEA